MLGHFGPKLPELVESALIRQAEPVPENPPRTTRPGPALAAALAALLILFGVLLAKLI